MKKILEHITTDWYKYVLELIVITAGILGAFALNNWNENRKNNAMETSYLVAIHTEFKDNRKQFEEVTQAHRRALVAWRGINSEYEKTTPNRDSLLIFMKDAWYTYTFDPSQSSIESLLSTSSIDVIQNFELRQLLLSWRDLIIDYGEAEIDSKMFVHNQLIPYMNDTFDRSAWKKGDIHVAKDKMKFKNMMAIRIGLLDEILDNNEQERSKVEQTMNRIIELTESK